MSRASVIIPERAETPGVLDDVAAFAKAYLDSLDDRPARSSSAEAAADAIGGALPDDGVGARRALAELIDCGLDATVASAGPRVFHFVIGGATPASLGGDWLAGTLDQMAYAWVATPFATRLEVVAMEWLASLFELSEGYTGVMTTGATMATFVGLGAARQWWGERHGVNIGERGSVGLPATPVFSSGYAHASVRKALAMLGMGRASLRTFASDATGRCDRDGMRRALQALDGTPAILVATVGEVNTGDSDPIVEMVDLAEEFGAWLHVDGAFGMFARLSARTRRFTEGVERADSITVDGHKWLNVPYDCGFAFVRHAESLTGAFAYSGDYLAAVDDPRPNFGVIGPESSRRARALSVWATLRAYGRSGYRAIVERHLDQAQRMASLVDAAPDLERLAETRLNIVCFRWNPGNASEDALNEINTRIGEEIIRDGRVYAGTTRYEGKVALRPAISNWRMRDEDVDRFVDVVREIGARVAASARASKR